MTDQEKRRKTDKIELSKRIRIVQDWVLQDHVTSDIITECKNKWDVTDRQAYRYLWAANKFFQEYQQVSQQRRVQYYLARKKKLLRDMDPKEKKTAAGVAAINRVLDSMAKMEGITIETLKLIGDPKQPVATTSAGFTSSIDYSKLSTPFLKELLKAMDA